ncbi:MAG: c-type cytochrome [Flavobacteriales bacterium]|nr:c-type cytochrome [Flavobacteriales bacterium]
MSGRPRPPKLRSLFIASAQIVLSLFLIAPLNPALGQAEDVALYAAGEKIFKGNCGACHKPDKDLTGPALKGSRERWEGQGDIYAWIKNSQDYLKTGNAYAKGLFEQWNKSVMTPNALTNEEIDAVLYYVDNYAPPVPPPGTVAEGPAPGAPQEIDIWPWMLVLGLLFLVVTLSLSGVKRSLTDAVRESEGKAPKEHPGLVGSIREWAWNNKVFASIIGLLVTVWVVVALWDQAWVIGVYGGDEVANYRPEQPILFNHTLHAGKADKGNLAIDCQYCHSSAEKSKHAGIPSTNVCMNCHKAVAEGRSPEGTAEIQKIYAAAGWDPATLQFTGEEDPVEWVKVHNLPDHAFFSHAQHVAVGKLDCRECHGPIDEEMTVAEQWAPLTMGWCIQCHNEKEVNMAGNGYYDETMARLEASDLGHRELKEYLEDEKITVKELGGWECAKCHY